MESRSYGELKALAKERKIKKYYVMTKAELLTILNMEELPRQYALEKKTYKELLKEARDRNIPRSWTKTRNELVELLYPTNVEN